MIGLFDYVAVLATVLVLIAYLSSFFKDIKYFSRIDPLKKEEKKEEK